MGSTTNGPTVGGQPAAAHISIYVPERLSVVVKHTQLQLRGGNGLIYWLNRSGRTDTTGRI
jgi:hypothetical protein